MKAQVLIVDDEPDILATLKARFESCDYEVITATNGAEGVEKTVRYRPRLIIMDVIMPTMSGSDAVRRIQALRLVRNIPILFLTALADYTSDNGKQRCLKIDGQSFPALAKPVDSITLVALAEKLISTSKDVELKSCV